MKSILVAGYFAIAFLFFGMLSAADASYRPDDPLGFAGNTVMAILWPASMPVVDYCLANNACRWKHNVSR